METTFMGIYRVLGFRSFPKLKGAFWGGLHDKDYSIWGSILASPDFGETTVWNLGLSGPTGFRAKGFRL